MAEDETPDPKAAPPTKAPKEPVNKLNEWLAALAIMMFLAGVLWVFLNFLRGMRL